MSETRREFVKGEREGEKVVTLPVRAAAMRGVNGEKEAVIVFKASSQAVDRYGEVLKADGWVLENFRKNPVFLNAHRYGDVGAVLGRVRAVEAVPAEAPSYLRIEVVFATEDNPAAKMAYDMYRKGFLHAVSVGFIPVEWEDVEEERDGGRGLRRVYKKQELLEVSAVAVPANPEALVVELSCDVGEESVERLWQAMQNVAHVRQLMEVARIMGVAGSGNRKAGIEGDTRGAAAGTPL